MPEIINGNSCLLCGLFKYAFEGKLGHLQLCFRCQNQVFSVSSHLRHLTFIILLTLTIYSYSVNVLFPSFF